MKTYGKSEQRENGKCPYTAAAAQVYVESSIFAFRFGRLALISFATHRSKNHFHFHTALQCSRRASTQHTHTHTFVNRKLNDADANKEKKKSERNEINEMT